MVKALIGDGSGHSFLLLLDPVHRVVDPADPLIQIAEQKVIRCHQFLLTGKGDDPGGGGNQGVGEGEDEESNKDLHDDGGRRSS